MSSGKRLSFAEAQSRAEKLICILEPYCQLVNIAGSLRRLKDTIGDIELVLIPKAQKDLFGNEFYFVEPIREALLANGYEIVKGGDKYIQATYDGVQYDIFVASPETYGCVLMIRTGSAEFSRKMVTPKRHGGYCPDNLYFKGGRLWVRGNDAPLSTPDEESVFFTLGMDWISPEKRS